MQMKDLIFTPFGVRCPGCRQLAKLSFEELQFNDAITCSGCENIFSPNIDTQVLLKMIKMVEESSSEHSLDTEN